MLIIDNESTVVPTLRGDMWMAVIRPKNDKRKYPGIILWSEIYQMTGPIKRSAQVLAAAGFVVVVPDVYHEFMENQGEALSYSAEDTDKGNSYKIKKKLESYDSDAQSAVQFLQNHPLCDGTIGTAGFCLGGGLAFRCAATNPGVVKAACCWYPTDLHKGSLSASGDNTISLCGNLKETEMMMIFGRQDPHIPAEGRVKLYTVLTEAGVSFEWHEFNAEHAFMRDDSSKGRYDGELALIAYQMAIGMFHRVLV